MVGRRPYSVAKIVSLIAAIVVLALLAWYLIARVSAAPPSHGRDRREAVMVADQPGRAYAAITAFADRSPSTAALTMPPAYPAPSPTGYNPSMPGDSRVSELRTIRTGELPRASGPARTASARNRPCQRWSIRGNPSATAAATNGGNTSRRSRGHDPRG